MLLISWATRWDTGAVEVTQGHELLAAARAAAPAAPASRVAAPAGPAISPDSATAATAITSRRWQDLPEAGRMRPISLPVIVVASGPPYPSDIHVIDIILRAILIDRQHHMTFLGFFRARADLGRRGHEQPARSRAGPDCGLAQLLW
jgi:hypothetical protein